MHIISFRFGPLSCYLLLILQCMAGLYIHIPFCDSKCIYCDFYSMANNHHLISQYIDTLLIEGKNRATEISSHQIKTVYLGGGTPSLLNKSQISKLILGLKEIFDFSSVEEFTIEVNPDDINIEYVEFLKNLGVNRVSMGVQSFRDEDLQFINRRHTSAQAIEAVESIKSAGIKNISIDLIYGIPGQNIRNWENNIDIATSLNVQHISAYSLMYEHGTRLTVMRTLGKVEEMDEDEVAEMYDYLVKSLKNKGFKHYEISNFALPGFESKHNSSYWNLTPYLGLGVAAHSFDGKDRRYNPANLKLYIETINQGKSFAEVEQISVSEKYDEYIMLRLRTSEGVQSKEIMDRFGSKYYDYFMKKVTIMMGRNMISHDMGRYYIPERHILVSDNITCELLWEE